LNQQVAPASRGVSRVEKLEVVGLLQEMRDRLVADFGFERVQMAGEAHLNRTTEPVVRFLVWLERTAIFSLRENAIAKEPGSSYLKPWRCASRLGLVIGGLDSRFS